MIGSRFGNRVPETVPFGDNSTAKRRMGRGKESSVATEGGEESVGRVKRGRKKKLQSGDGGQPEGSS
jgi:hypothetical protein